ncbi:OmpA family protein [Mangrovibacterium sp.]|uniref:OmpA family protein n=1 Tax=Mangrovibacterium sp. TaxID=1961364 RepID=UPI0035642C02
MKIAALIVLIVMWFPEMLSGQNPAVDSLSQESKVILAEEDIHSLIKTLVDYKRGKSTVVQTHVADSSLVVEEVAPKTKVVSKTEITPNANVSSKAKLNQEEDLMLENKILKIQLSMLQEQLAKLQNVPKASTAAPVQMEDKSQDLRDMQYELTRMQNQISELASQLNSRQTTVAYPVERSVSRETFIAPPTIFPDTIYSAPQVSLSDEMAIANLQNQIDSLHKASALSSDKQTPAYSQEMDSLRQQIVALRKDMATKSVSANNFDAMRSKYAGFAKVVYFENNSSTIGLDGESMLTELGELLETNDKLDLMLTGFASKMGGPAYNEKLSMLRTEAVKRAIILKGIPATRILSQYKGIDYTASSDSQARRVEISIIVRR